MTVIENFKKDINNSLKEIQNTGKQLEALKEETQKSLKELQENTTKQVKELNKTIQDIKMEIQTIKKSQRETTLEIENLGKRSGVRDVRITNRIQEIEERTSGSQGPRGSLTPRTSNTPRVSGSQDSRQALPQSKRVIQTLREHKCQPRFLYPSKLSITIDGETKIFHDKTKFTQYLSINPALQRIINGKH
jgi:DNA repair exonuclease SbcCD ATPase subunit